MRGGFVPILLLLPAALLLSGCGLEPGGPPLVSAATPPAVDAAGSEPQPVGSLPPGAYNPGAAGYTTNDPLATHPSYGSFTFRTTRPR